MTNNIKPSPSIAIADALQIIKSYQQQAPVIVVPIAKALGLDVYKVTGWPDGLSGKLIRDSSTVAGFSIHVNANHPKARRRFTIAHEIAHFVLHRHLINEELLDDALYRSGLSNAIEAEANKMAADILMPWHLVDSAIDDKNMDNIETLAKLFEVSKTAMSIRLGVPAFNT